MTDDKSTGNPGRSICHLSFWVRGRAWKPWSSALWAWSGLSNDFAVVRAPG